MTTLAAIAWGLAVAMFVGVINLCVISTILLSEPPRPDDQEDPDGSS